MSAIHGESSQEWGLYIRAEFQSSKLDWFLICLLGFFVKQSPFSRSFRENACLEFTLCPVCQLSLVSRLTERCGKEIPPSSMKEELDLFCFHFLENLQYMMSTWRFSIRHFFSSSIVTL